MRKKLTNELISSYTKLEDRSRALLAGFARSFPDCSIEWISTEEAEKWKEGLIPANGTTSEISTQLPSIKPRKQKSRAAVSAQPRLFKENYE